MRIIYCIVISVMYNCRYYLLKLSILVKVGMEKQDEKRILTTEMAAEDGTDFKNIENSKL